MKKVVYSAMALAIAIGGIAVSKANTHHATAKVFWQLKAGNHHTAALTPTAYTQVADESACIGVTTVCGIYAEPATGAPTARPNLTSDVSLRSDLVKIQANTDPGSNASGEVYFKD